MSGGDGVEEEEEVTKGSERVEYDTYGWVWVGVQWACERNLVMCVA